MLVDNVPSLGRRCRAALGIPQAASCTIGNPLPPAIQKAARRPTLGRALLAPRSSQPTQKRKSRRAEKGRGARGEYVPLVAAAALGTVEKVWSQTETLYGVATSRGKEKLRACSGAHGNPTWLALAMRGEVCCAVMGWDGRGWEAARASRFALVVNGNARGGVAAVSHVTS